jgi:hypothetical protein
MLDPPTPDDPKSRRTSNPGPGGGDTPGTPAGGCLTPVTSLVVGALVFVSVLAGLTIGRCSAPSPAAPAASVQVVRDSPNVITAIRDLARLESAEFHIERVIDLTETQRRFFGLVEAKDAILLVAAGDVSAGVDLAELRESDVVIDKAQNRIEISLPPAKILSTRLDNERTYVHTRSTDALAQRKESLETDARRRAEATLESAAKDGRILERAEKNAAKTLEMLARSFGYSDVHVKTRAKLDERALPPATSPAP